MTAITWRGNVLLSAAQRAGRAALGLVLPPKCLGCGDAVHDAGALCSRCWPRMSFVAPPYCAGCGYPFDFDAGDGALCGSCVRAPLDFDRARSVLRYDDQSRDLIIAFKHSDRTDAAPAYGLWMARAGSDLLAEADLVAPVPLHRSRLIARRFNQAALLAHAVGRATRVEVVSDLLVRTRATPSQGTLSAVQRRQNVRGAFAVRPSRAAEAAGRRIVLVDDVYTTGATVSACARTLRRAGARAVDVLTLARVVRPAA